MSSILSLASKSVDFHTDLCRACNSVLYPDQESMPRIAFLKCDHIFHETCLKTACKKAAVQNELMQKINNSGSSKSKRPKKVQHFTLCPHPQCNQPVEFVYKIPKKEKKSKSTVSVGKAADKKDKDSAPKVKVNKLKNVVIIEPVSAKKEVKEEKQSLTMVKVGLGVVITLVCSVALSLIFQTGAALLCGLAIGLGSSFLVAKVIDVLIGPEAVITETV